jgi:hypothetical protein
VRNRSGQDPLNYPIKLNNKIAALAGVIESADAKPTNSHEVFTLPGEQAQTEAERGPHRTAAGPEPELSVRAWRRSCPARPR